MRILQRVVMGCALLQLLPAVASHVHAADDAGHAADAAGPTTRPEGAPDEAAIKAGYVAQFATSDLGADKKPYYDYQTDLEEVTYVGTHEGDWYHDGTPKTQKTTVYSIKAAILITKKQNFGEHKVTKEKISLNSGFFKDEFGDWKYRNQKTVREDVK